MHKPVIGVIGGIGSGKSAVAAELARRGGALISGDALGHEGLRQDDIRRQVVARWGAKVLNVDGAINRRQLAAIVFADPAELRALEAIQFPYIGRRIREEIAQAQQDPAIRHIVLDAAVLLEADWRPNCDRLLFVDTPREVRLERLRQHRAWTEDELSARERNQLPLEVKRQAADVVIDNSDSHEAMSRQVDEIFAKWDLHGSTERVR